MNNDEFEVIKKRYTHPDKCADDSDIRGFKERQASSYGMSDTLKLIAEIERMKSRFQFCMFAKLCSGCRYEDTEDCQQYYKHDREENIEDSIIN